MLEPHHGEIRPPLDRAVRANPKDARPIGDLEIPSKVSWLRCLRLDPVVVLGLEADDPPGPVAEVEQERPIERAEVPDKGGIEPSRGMLEADLGYRAGRVRPPGVEGPVGEPEVGCQIAEQV